jgi:catechol 2,3-dioxygenase-like lactoylglutathione lyase family enzyme
MEINGVAHIILRVSRFEQCVAFYDALMPRLGLEVVYRSDDYVYNVGGRTAVGIRRPARSLPVTLTRNWRPVSTTSASVPVAATTLTSCTCRWPSSGRSSCEPWRKGRGHRAITRSPSGIPRGSAWRSTTFPVKACSRTAHHSPPPRIIRSEGPASNWITDSLPC